MLTIFAAPKPFRGHIGVIQRNAIQSWTLLRPACEIVLFGDEPGIPETAKEFGLQHIPDVARTPSGTPLVSDLFRRAEASSDRSLFCYTNSDIILMSDFTEAVRRVAAERRRFLLVGHRSNLDVEDPIDFRPDWESDMRRRVQGRGILAGHTSIDFFVFSRGLFGEIPDFAIGRVRWDNWMLYRARSLRVPLIDATPVLTAVHQNHDYSHHPQGKDGTRSGDEAMTNARLSGDKAQMFALDDATHLLTPEALRGAYDREHLLRRFETLPVLYPWGPMKWVGKAASSSRALRSRLGLTLSSIREGSGR